VKTTILNLYCSNKSPLGNPRNLYAEISEEGQILDCFFETHTLTAKEAVPVGLRPLCSSSHSLVISVLQFTDLERRFKK
tara:strand:- start:152 stop:388 length:237 start_codon:yes stop_codon:yes gene_type:complete